VVAISASAGECSVLEDVGGICDFTDLAANCDVKVTVTWKAEQPAETYDVAVGVSTSGDIAVNNDAVRGRVTTHGLTDLELRVGAPVSAFRNSTFALPEISVVNGNERAYDARLEVTLPAQVTLVDVSASNAICSGTRVLRCDFSELDAGSISTVNITVHANEAGTFTSGLQLTSSNDGNAANDSKDVAVQINDAGNASTTAGGKGGGSFEWLGLALLALLVALRLHQENRRVNLYRAFCFFPTTRGAPKIRR
jgi:MYXO-CTERM domain-containing protein